MSDWDDHGYGGGMSGGVHSRHCTCEDCVPSNKPQPTDALPQPTALRERLAQALLSQGFHDDELKWMVRELMPVVRSLIDEAVAGAFEALEPISAASLLCETRKHTGRRPCEFCFMQTKAAIEWDMPKAQSALAERDRRVREDVK